MTGVIANVEPVIRLVSPSTEERWEIQVLFEDEYIMAINKPPCLLTAPDAYDSKRPNLMKMLHAGIEEKKKWATSRNLTYLMNAHRLDFETSGILILAKSKPVLVSLVNIFGSEKPFKKYIAIAHGAPPKEEFTVDMPLSPHPKKRGVIRIDPKNGKKAITKFKAIERFSGYTLFECFPLTGRTHQIRVHLRYAGCPIVGDAVYGGAQLFLSKLKPDFKLGKGKVERPLIGTVALHSTQIDLQHPVTGQTITIVAPVPEALQVALKYLRKYASLNSPAVEQTKLNNESV